MSSNTATEDSADDDGGGIPSKGTAAAAPPAATDAHRSSCLRRRTVRASLPQMWSDLTSPTSCTTTGTARVDERSDRNDDQRLGKEILGLNYCSDAHKGDTFRSSDDDRRDAIRRDLLDRITYVRADGSVLQSVNSSVDSDVGTGSSLIVVKNGSEEGRGHGFGDQQQQQSAAATEEEERQRDHRQIASTAKLLGTAFLNNDHSQSTSSGAAAAAVSGPAHHDARTAREAGRAVVADQQISSGSAATDADAEAETSGGGGIWSAATGIASGLASVVAGTVSYAFSTPRRDDGDADEDDYGDWDDVGSFYDDDKHGADYVDATDADGEMLGVDYDDAAPSSVGNKGTSRGAVLLDEERDEILNVGIVLDCLRMLLHHAESGIAVPSSSDYHHDHHSGNAKAVLLYRFGTNTSSLSEFCKRAAAAELETKGHSADATSRASAETLAKLSPSDMDMTLLTMVSAGYAALSSDGDIVAILPRGGAAAATANKSTSPLNDVDIAIFRLRSTVSTLERRIEHLSDQANAVQGRALKAKKQGRTSLAVTYLKRRNLLQAEADKASSMLLNVENSLQSLEQAKADAEVVKAYKLAGDAMKVARLSEEEGGLGLNADAVEKLMDDLAEGNDDLEEISSLIAADAGGSAGPAGDGDIDEEELMKEMEELEVEMLAGELASTSLGKKKNIGSSDTAVASAAEAVMESKVEVETHGKKEALLG